nr:serine protease snake-like [Vanessa tameamea]
MFVLFIGLFVAIHGLKTGDECTTPNGMPGMCKGVRECESAIKQIKQMIVPPLCDKVNLIVCCEEQKLQMVMAPKIDSTRNRKMLTPVYKETCESLSSNITLPMRKSLQKCLEYQDMLVYPCQYSLTPNAGKVRAQNCNWKPESLIIGGTDSYQGEFPHMAHLGYGKNNVQYKCAGVLISDRFVLTAGHCTHSRLSGAVTKVRIGFLRQSEEITELTEYSVKEIYKHPSYNPTRVYDDIALVETDRSMHLSQFAVPACLHDGSPINDTEVFATGWGTTQFKRDTNPDTLQKVTLEKFTNEECRAQSEIHAIRNMPSGYDPTKQICYGHRYMSRDSCQGDSGGPIQIKHPEIKCMYLINGIISSGKWCGIPGSPGFYTRLSNYIDWIESVVWP